MPSYKNIILDCDGVILDSNQLKIKAMEHALKKHGISESSLVKCITYFKNNFGKSRLLHLRQFERILNVKLDVESIIHHYADYLDKTYRICQYTTGFFQHFSNLENRNLFVVSGSDQEELRKVFSFKDNKMFMKILGSPVTKSNNIKSLIESFDLNLKDTCYVGDSVADVIASRENEIDFIGFHPYSNNSVELKKLCKKYNYEVIGKWKDLV